MRRFDTSFPNDPPEVVVATRIEAIAYDLERIADFVEGEGPGPDPPWLTDDDESRLQSVENRVDELEAQLDVLTDDVLERLRAIESNTDLQLAVAAERGDVDPDEVDALREGGDD